MSGFCHMVQKVYHFRVSYSTHLETQSKAVPHFYHYDNKYFKVSGKASWMIYQLSSLPASHLLNLNYTSTLIVKSLCKYCIILRAPFLVYISTTLFEKTTTLISQTFTFLAYLLVGEYVHINQVERSYSTFQTKKLLA